MKNGLCENVFRLLFFVLFHLTTALCPVTVACSIALWCIPTTDRVSNLTVAFPPCLDHYEAFISFFSPLCAYSRLFRLKCTVSSVPIVRLCSFAHALAHFFVIAHSALSLFERSFCTFHTTSSHFLTSQWLFVTFTWISPLCASIYSHGGSWHIK